MSGARRFVLRLTVPSERFGEPRTSNAELIRAILRWRAHTPGLQVMSSIPVSSPRLMKVTTLAVAGVAGG